MIFCVVKPQMDVSDTMKGPPRKFIMAGAVVEGKIRSACAVKSIPLRVFPARIAHFTGNPFCNNLLINPYAFKLNGACPTGTIF